MSNFVVINGKRYAVNSANRIIEHNTNSDIHEELHGQNSITAKWSRHIASINEQLKTATYKPGRPTIHKVEGTELGM